MRPPGIPQKGTNHPAIILIGISTMDMMDKNDDDDGLIKSQSNKTKWMKKEKVDKQDKMNIKIRNKKGAEDSQKDV